MLSIILMFTLAAMTTSGQPTGVDVNRDGLIDRAEFSWANPEVDLYEEFGRLDLNNDGFIDNQEEEFESSRADRFRSLPRCKQLNGRCKMIRFGRYRGWWVPY